MGVASLLDFRILGPLEVVEHDRQVVVGAPKVRALLAMLLLHRGEVVSTDRLVEALWGERAPATASKTVQVYVSNLRKALGDGLLVTRGHGYLLKSERGQTDSDRFDELVTEGHRLLASGDGQAARDRLREALALWRGPALADFAYQEFAQGAIARLEESKLAALEERIDADLALGEHAALVGELEALVRQHPSRERLVGQLMLALYRCGRQSDALKVYRRVRHSMVEELGLEPGPRLHELERAILAQDPALERTRASRARPKGPARRRGVGGWLIAAAGALLLAALVAVGVKLSGSGASSVRVAPNSVAVIDPQTDRVAAAVGVGSGPGSITTGAGSVWVANQDDQTISRIDPRSLRTLRYLTLRDSPTGLAATPTAIWVVQSDVQATSVSVTPIDPQFNAVGRSYRVDTIVPGDTGAIATQGDAVWVAPGSGLLTRLDPRTGRPLHQIDPNSGPAAIAIGDGATWLTDPEANNVTRVDATGLTTPIAVGDGPVGIAVSADGVWVADSLDDAVKRIDPGTRSVATTISVGRSPAGIAVGAGSVWVANSGDGTISRIDPRTNRVIARITVGGSPQALTVADGRIWVTVDARSIEPAAGGASGGTIRTESPIAPYNMDPALAYQPDSWQLLYATCAKLLNYPDKPGLAGRRLTAEVATGLPSRSSDGKTYTFTVRQGFRFSPPSNLPVTAQTFKSTIERALNPTMKAPLAYEFADIAGAAAYMAGKTTQITGVAAQGNTLTIHLLASDPQILTRMAQPIFCAVPPNTPINPKGEPTIPSAGPYYVASYTARGLVLLRNPNYQGDRPHRFERIERDVGVSYQRAVTDVKSGAADYTTLAGLDAGSLHRLASELAARYGPDSQAARRGGQQYFDNPWFATDYLVLNTHRPLFSDVRLRRAVSYAVDRRALATLGSPLDAGPARPTDHYLPPEMPGFLDRRTYPIAGDPARARALAQGRGRTAVLYTCESPLCAQEAQVLKTDLAAIGLQLQIRAFPVGKMSALESRPGEKFDIGYADWIPDYPDPGNVLGPLLTTGAGVPSFADPAYQRRLAQIDQLTGPQRYPAYGRLDLDLARNAAPLIAYANSSSPDFFSARIGCQIYGTYSVDLAALCVKHTRRGSRTS